MKRLLAIVLTVCMLLPAAIIVHAADYTDQTMEIVYQDKFDDPARLGALPNYWKMYSSGQGCKWVVAEDPTHAGNQVFELTRSKITWATNPYIEMSSLPNGAALYSNFRIHLRFYQRPKTADTADSFMMVLRGIPSDTVPSGTNYLEIPVRNGLIAYKPGGYTVGEWVDLDVEVDVQAWTASVYANTNFVTTLSMKNQTAFATEGINRIVLDTPNWEGYLGTTYVDDLTVSIDHKSELQSVANCITFDKLSSEPQDEVISNLHLMESYDKYDVEWSSENPAAVDANGVVTRRSFTQTAVLVAKIKKTEDIYFHKQFTVTVPRIDFADDQTILREYADFALGMETLTDEPAGAITHDLRLPTQGPDGISIAWSSDEPSVLDSQGVVTRPSHETGDTTVTLTATLELNGTTHTISHTLTVLKEKNPAIVLEEAMAAVTYESLTTEDKTRITKSMTLPTGHENGARISWESDHPETLSDTGAVTRGQETTEVTLTATFSYNGFTETKAYPFTVLLNEASMVAKDLAQIDATGWDALTESFYLPRTGALYGTAFSWVTSNPTRVSLDKLSGNYRAQVQRPVFEMGNARLTLTVTAVNGDASETREYPVTVLAHKSDKDIVDTALANLRFSDISTEAIDSVTKNLSLITALPDDIRVTWASDNTAVINDQGMVFNPPPDAGDAAVNLTATLSRNYYSASTVFAITVKTFMSNDELLEKLSSSLTFDVLSDQKIDGITEDLTLPSDWHYGSAITWTSSSPYAVVEDGRAVVTRPEYGSGGAAVRLTATIHYGGSSIERVFVLHILEKNYLKQIEDLWTIDCEEWTLGDTVFRSPRGEWTMPAEPQFAVAADPEDANNTVIQMNGGNKGSGYLIYKYPETAEGMVLAGMRMYICEDNSRVVAEILGKSGAQAVLTMRADGVAYTNSGYPAASSRFDLMSHAFPIGKWFDLRFEVNTNLELFHIYVSDDTGERCLTAYGNVYLNDELYDSTLGVPYNYYGDVNRSNALQGFRLSEYRESATMGDTVYIDDLSFKKRVTYSETLLNTASTYEREFLAKNNISALTQNLKLPKLNVLGVTITAASGNKELLSDTGVITQSDAAQTAEWIVSFDDGTVVYRKHYLITIAGIADSVTDEEAVKLDLEQAIQHLRDNYLLNNLKSNLNFLTTGKYGSTLTTVSSNPSAVTDTGAVIRGNAAKNATLAITAVKGACSAAGDIAVTVAKLDDNGSGTGGGGGGGRPSGGTVSSPSYSSPNTSGNLVNIAPEPVTPVYTDVPAGYWAYDAIAYLTREGIVNGSGGNAFEPERSIKREEFVKLLAEALPLAAASDGADFTDMETGAWYTGYIASAVEKGIVQGAGDGSFGIGRQITRQDMAVMMYRAAGLLPEKSSRTFQDDAQIAGYAKDAVYTLQSQGIINGRIGNNFEPDGYATRAEAAAMLYRMIKNNLLG